MVTIDLTTPPPPAKNFLDGLPRRLAMTLPELRRAAELAGGAPLPFDLADPQSVGQQSDDLSDRLGESRESAEAAAYSAALASLHDAEDSLRRRGLVTDEGADPGIVGAMGLLATPQLALDIDVATGTHHVKAWHRHCDGAVATLATRDGIVFELAWFPVGHWTSELARVTTIPEELSLSASSVPTTLDVPYQLVDAVGEAIRSGRHELVPVLLSHTESPVLADDEPLGPPEAGAALSAVHTEGRGRLRILAAEVSRDQTTHVGVVSWVLLADGWHSLTPHHADDGARVSVRRVDPADLATELAPVLAQVTS